MLMRRVIAIFVDTTVNTGNTHPELKEASGNYRRCFLNSRKAKADVNDMIRNIMETIAISEKNSDLIISTKGLLYLGMAIVFKHKTIVLCYVVHDLNNRGFVLNDKKHVLHD